MSNAPSQTPEQKAASRIAKASAPAKPAKAAAQTAASTLLKESKHPAKKPKLVRDSFTFPAVDYAQIGALKQRALQAGHEVKKSELLRAGLAVLCALSDAELIKALQAIDRLKPGRPAK